MGATTTEGTGQGSVENVFPKIINDVVKSENLSNVNEVFTNVTNDLEISTADGTSDVVDAKSITIRSGAGYPSAGDEVDADGGSVFIYAGQANGEGEGGNVVIQAGNTGDGPDANAGDVTIRGGDADVADNSDAGDVQIYGGDGSLGVGDSDGGSITLEAGNAGDDGQAGWVYINAGNSGNGDGGDSDPEAGGVQIYAGNSNSSTNTNGGDIELFAGGATGNGRGGDLNFQAGGSGGTDRGGDINFTAGNNSGAGRNGHIYLNSIPRMPVFANASERDSSVGTPTNGMFCYNTATGNMEVYVGGAWKSVDVSAIV